MAAYRKIYNPNQPSAEDRALAAFTDLMVQKIKDIKSNWQKPWFTEGTGGWPRNLHGRHYNGSNALMLMLHAEKMVYHLPVWCTFNGIQREFNKPEMPADVERVSVKKGEKSFPIFLTTFTVVDKDTKQKIPYEDYKKLSAEEQKQFNVYPKQQVFNVFSVEQTNLREVRPEIYAKFEEECGMKQKVQTGEEVSFPAFEAMVANNAWLCPIKQVYQDQAYYSIKEDAITTPLQSQFNSKEAWIGTTTHEMIHSTGAPSRLNRIKPTAFATRDYSEAKS